MFFCTYCYMYVWVYTGEINAKRIRERYLQAVLRQDIAFFDNVGAGEVATRISTDTRRCLMHFLTFLGFIYSPVSRLGAARNFRESRACSQLFWSLRLWLRACLRPVLAFGSCHVIYASLSRHHGWAHE